MKRYSDDYIVKLIETILKDRDKEKRFDQLIEWANFEIEKYGDVRDDSFYEEELDKLVFGEDYETI